MNPLTNMKNVIKLSEQELYTGNKTSWHDQYKDSAWVFAAGFPYDLTEGDLVCIFSQYGEIVHINLVRDKDTGKSRGFCFVCYEDQRSTVLTVDNFNGIKIMNRTMRVDHVANYKVPKNAREEAAKAMPSTLPPQAAATPSLVVKKEPAPLVDDFRETLADQIRDDIKLPPRLPIYPVKEEAESVIGDKVKVKKEKKSKKEKKHKKEKKRKKRRRSSSGSDGSSDDERTKRKNK